MSEKARPARGKALFVKSCITRHPSASRGYPASSQRHRKETELLSFPRGGPLCTSGAKASLKSRDAAAASPASSSASARCQIRRRHHQLPVGARSPARHQGHQVRAARRLHSGRRPRQVPGDQQLPGRVLPRRRQGGRQALLVRVFGPERGAASVQQADQAGLRRLPR